MIHCLLCLVAITVAGFEKKSPYYPYLWIGPAHAPFLTTRRHHRTYMITFPVINFETFQVRYLFAGYNR